MAVAPSPLVDREHKMNTAAATAPVPKAEGTKANPLLIGFLIAMAVFPFVAGFVPAPVREYLGSLFR